MTLVLNTTEPTATPAATSPSQHAAYRERAYANGRDFLQAVDGITAGIASRRAESEMLGKVPDASVEDMVRAGVFRALTPMQWGGLEMDPASFFAGIMKIAAADASTAWIGGQLNVHSFEIALMDPRMQEEFWADGPSTRASSAYAPLGKARDVDGGVVLSGTWTFSSGVDHAQWVILGGGLRNFVVPRSDFTVSEDSWDVQGLKGTGSKSVTLDEVFVPDYRIHRLADTYNDANPGWAVNDRPLYRLSWMGIFNSTISNSAIGATIGGLDAFIAETRVRLSKRGTGVPVVENPFMHLRLANALSRVNTVRNRHLANWRELFDQACRGEDSTPHERMRVRFESTDSTSTCFDAIHEIWPVAGAGACATANPLQQVFRDLMAMRLHGSAGREAAAGMYIKTLFGMPGPTFSNMGTLAYYK
jgi:3-hydroxy-9,10-secoandrosta-1,3,5(10)-triene-9,17-dione monooxygenase